VVNDITKQSDALKLYTHIKEEWATFECHQARICRSFRSRITFTGCPRITTCLEKLFDPTTKVGTADDPEMRIWSIARVNDNSGL